MELQEAHAVAKYPLGLVAPVRLPPPLEMVAETQQQRRKQLTNHPQPPAVALQAAALGMTSTLGATAVCGPAAVGATVCSAAALGAAGTLRYVLQQQ